MEFRDRYCYRLRISAKFLEKAPEIHWYFRGFSLAPKGAQRI